jgi:hypothetical protein
MQTSFIPFPQAYVFAFNQHRRGHHFAIIVICSSGTNN